MRWSEIPHLPDTNCGGGGGGPSSSSSTPQIKNHSVTHHRGHLYCFGGYDGRRNHQTLLIYSLKEQRWISPSLSLGLLLDEGGGGGDSHGGFNINNFDNSRNNDSSHNSNSTQDYTVRGVPPPGRNGHTATLATTTRRRRRLRRQQQQLQHYRRDDAAAAVVDHHYLHPRSDDDDGLDDINTVSGREGDENNRSSDGRRTLMGANAIDQNRETTTQRQEQHQLHHLHRHPWRPHPPSIKKRLGGLSIADLEHTVVDVMDEKIEENGTNNAFNRHDYCVEEAEADAGEARKKSAYGNDSICSRNTTDDIVDGMYHQRIEQQGQEPEQVEELVKDQTADDSCLYRCSRNEVEAPSVRLEERENDLTNVINPMDDDDEDDDEDVNNSDNDDDYDAQIIIIGGWLGAGPYAASDMWVLDISGGLDRLRWFQPPTLGTPPGPCNMHSADFIPSRGEVYVFRGGNGREYLNDLHALDVETYIWRKVQTNGTPPQQRANHSSALLEDKSHRRTTPTTNDANASTDTTSNITAGGGRSQLFIFGGWNGSERLNDIHILDTDTSTWSTPRVLGIKPHPRAGMTLTALRGRMYLFGGSGTSSKCFDDLQVFDHKEMAWLDVNENTVRMPQSSNADNNSRRQQVTYRHSSLPSSYHENGWEMVSDSGECDNGGGGSSSRLGNGNQRSWSASTSSTWDVLGGQDGTSIGRDANGIKFADWRSYAGSAPLSCSANPNDEDTVPSVYVSGKPPGRRAGHTATAVAGRFIYVFGGSCGTDYLNDFFVLDTDPPPQMKVTEPPSPQLYASRVRHFYNDEEFSDVTFLVEGRKVFGHKLVLSTVSDCFRAMFMAGFRESASNKTEIEIPNCSYSSFLTMMKYIYTGQSPQDIDIFGSDGIDRAISLLELADQFFLYHLKQIIEGVLQPAVNDETCTFLHQVAQKTNANQLESYCRYYERNMSGNLHQ